MKTSLANVRKPMVPMNGMTGVLEKRLIATSSLALLHAASIAGSIYDRDTDSDLLLADTADWHNNHGEDPATDTMNLSDAAAFNMDWARGIESAMSLADTVHISLDGVHAPPSEYEMVAANNISAGEAVYISGNNAVKLANAFAGVIPNTAVFEVFGLALHSAVVGETVTVRSEGYVLLDDWTAVIGSASLTPGAAYYLDTVPGGLSETAPTDLDRAVCLVARAVTTKKLDLEVGEKVIL
jgi:hypothetical protein